MSWVPLHLKFLGCRPLIMHNGRLCMPTDEFAKALRKVSGKRHKTDADHEQMAKLEFLGALWLAGEPLRPVLPADAILACLLDGAKRLRSGTAAKAAIDCDEHAILQYEGPTDPHELLEMPAFRLQSRVKVKQNRIVRTRPIFRLWKADVTLHFEDALLDRDQAVEFATRAGFEIGIGDWRPRYGRFQVETV